MKALRKELLQLAHASGYEHPGYFSGKDIEVCTGVNRFSTLDEVLGYEKDKRTRAMEIKKVG